MDEPITCTINFHVDGCAGNAGGEHELRPVTEIWCRWCDRPAVLCFRVPGEQISECVAHGVERITMDLRPDEPQAAEDSLFCRLRGKTVAISECVASCPAPEQREVCAFEFNPAPRVGIEQYQAEGR